MKLRGSRFRRGRAKLAREYIHGEGIEIGGLNEPLAVPEDAHVIYVDRFETSELRGRFPELAREKLVEVGIVDDGVTLAEFADSSLDFVVANHFLEHVEDPLAAIAAQLRVLRTEGVSYLAIPDMRFTFDRERRPTSTDHVIRDHREGPAVSRRGHYEEWARTILGAEDPAAEGAKLDKKNHEIHFHAWTPYGFGDLLRRAREELGMPFTVAELERNRHEFIAVLRKTGP